MPESSAHTPSLAERKAALRREAMARRHAQDEKDSLSRQIVERLQLLSQVAAAERLLCYVDVCDEVRTRELLIAWLQRGQPLSVPYCTAGRLELFQLQRLDELAPGKFGILEPLPALRTPERQVSPSSIDVVMVPGVAFDRRGARLGHGHGYYDKLLAELPGHALRIALAYECQLVEHVPSEPHDVPVHCIVTERTIHHCSPPPGDGRHA